MRAKEKISRRLLAGGILALFAGFFFYSCPGSYNPSLYPSYDVLNPGPEVRVNPLGFTVLDPKTGSVSISWDKLADGRSKDGLFLVNKDFLQWVYELQAEIKKIRKKG